MKENIREKKTVFIAMSGGVDSSVAAALMKKAGFKAVGVFMKPPSFAESYGGHSGTCSWKQDREDAMRVAAKLDIPLLTWDFSKDYEKHVAKYMIEGYREGLTPNPDIMCNKFIKFGLFLDKALEAGADFIATGHYVRLRQRNANMRMHANDTNKFSQHSHVNLCHSHRHTLLKAKDLNKDQSYFLYTLTQKQLKHCLFPIGDYAKPEVRKMAKKFGLPNWNKKDSQGVCFVGPLKVDEFLKKYIKPQKGVIIRKSDGKILGEHDGVWYYTIGQRHGMGLSVGEPYYIVNKDVKKNILYVDGLKNQKSKIKNQNYKSKFKGLQIKDFNWINGERKTPLDCKVKTRYRQKDLDCVILKNGSDSALVRIKETNISIAPGQSAVFYKGNEMLGGGIINNESFRNS